MLKCHVMFLSARRLWYALKRNYMCYKSCVPAQVTALLAFSSMLINQQHTLNKLFLNRNAYKTRLCIYWMTKMSWPEAHGSLTLYFLGALVHYSLIQCFVVTLWNITMGISENHLCLFVYVPVEFLEIWGNHFCMSNT